MISYNNTQRVLNYFKQVDPIMARLFAESLKGKNPIVLPKAVVPEKYYVSIVRSIVSQQISTKAARSVYIRLNNHLKTKDIDNKISPSSVLSTTTKGLRACGLSRQKVLYIRYNAKHWHTIPINELQSLTDEKVISILTKLHGVGRWTAEMFLIFSLGRENVFSYGDLGLMQSLLHNYKFKKHWKQKIIKTVEKWGPYKTYASLALWHHKDNVLLNK